MEKTKNNIANFEHNVEKAKESYDKPKAVNNMSEFFDTEYGESLKSKISKTKQQYQGQSVYEVIEKTDNPYLKKGDK